MGHSGGFGRRTSRQLAWGGLYSSGFYALLDTKTPLRFALVRVTLTTLLGILFALPLPHWLGIDQKWGVAGLTASAGIAGWIEFTSASPRAKSKRSAQCQFRLHLSESSGQSRPGRSALAYLVKAGHRQHASAFTCLGRAAALWSRSISEEQPAWVSRSPERLSSTLAARRPRLSR